ncbi:DUF3179 domain-containing (seleno)protein [Haloarcula sp. JP-L23]|uniref:DUF3179 domain-containing (seleno)protein n=1 Tax=Haloarcula sp. JP-L23 TaxID=2716717 RepID=UPI00140F41BC|nr:DUF3179 domain-containing protein [Haloarcula sp. JP-L23]
MTVTDVLPRDAIPSIDDPTFGAHYFGAPDDEVVVVDGDPPRAYPVRVLGYHEIVNAEADGDPVAVTWCPICWSAAVYDRTLDGRTLTFGVSGKLADDALVMYDRETDSEWRQPSGEAIAGPFEGTRLDARPAPILTAARFRAEYPDGEFLQPVRGGPDASDAQLRERHEMDGYEAYVDREAFGRYGMRGEGDPRAWDRDDLDPKTLVLGVVDGDDAMGYPRPRVRAAGGAVADTVGGRAVVVFEADGSLYAYENDGYAFERTHEGETTFSADETFWNPLTGESEDGRSLTRLPARTLFAFAWQDDHGPDAFYEP